MIRSTTVGCVTTCDQCSWICGFVVRIWFFCNLVTRCLIGRLHLWANSTNQITWFQSSINVKFLKRETKSSSADCHDDDLFYIPMFYLPFFLIFRLMHPPVIYRDHKMFLKLIKRPIFILRKINFKIFGLKIQKFQKFFEIFEFFFSKNSHLTRSRGKIQKN